MDPNSLPQTSTERLLAVADIIELTPQRWNQDVWYQDRTTATPNPPQVVGRAAGAAECDTVACVAGWAVALATDVGPWPNDWNQTGAYLLGLDITVAEKLFRQNLPLSAPELADVLRRLAKLDKGERYGLKIRDVLTAEQYQALTNAE